MEKTIGDKTFEIRPLKRGEIKELRKKGINLAALDPANADDAVDEVMSIVLGDRIEEIDDMDNPDALKLFKEIVDLSYSRPPEEELKNS